MPTDHPSATCDTFDPETAQIESLNATLSRVRFRRRVRRTATTSVILMAALGAVWLALPTPLPRSGPAPVADSIRIRSLPLTPEQKIVSSVIPDLYIHTPSETSGIARIATPSGASVPRLGEREFQSLLATYDLYCIQVNGAAPEIRSLHHAE